MRRKNMPHRREKALYNLVKRPKNDKREVEATILKQRIASGEEKSYGQ